MALTCLRRYKTASTAGVQSKGSAPSDLQFTSQEKEMAEKVKRFAKIQEPK